MNPKKTWLIVKDETKLEEVKAHFHGTGINVTSDAKKHLGAWLGDKSSVIDHLKTKIDEWINTIVLISEVAKSQPHAAYSAFTNGIISQWLYTMRTSPDVSSLLQPLEDAIRTKFLPSLLGRDLGDIERDILALPVHMGGLGIINPTTLAPTQHQASLDITQPLSDAIIEQKPYNLEVTAKQQVAKLEAKKKKDATDKELLEGYLLHSSHLLKRCIELAREKGSSSWLTALPIARYGFALHKGDFRDAICLRYNWTPARMPTECVCGQGFTVSHAMDCHTGGFPTRRHNEVRDITAELMSEVCPNVTREPQLQTLTGETFNYRANIEDGARADISADGFWGNNHQRAFFDVRVFNPNARSYQNTSIKASYQKQEREKRRVYEERIRDVEMGSFTPLVFSAYGGMGKSSQIFYKRLSSIISDKRGESYSTVITWIRCRLSFSRVRSAINAIRGTRSKPPTVTNDQSFSCIVVEARLSN